MSLSPAGEELKRAVQWVAEEKLAAPERPLKQLVEEACLKFDLSPLEAEHLLRAVKARQA